VLDDAHYQTYKYVTIIQLCLQQCNTEKQCCTKWLKVKPPVVQIKDQQKKTILSAMRGHVDSGVTIMQLDLTSQDISS